MAEKYGVTLCVKAHVGAAVFNTPTTLQVMQAISSPAFGIDMDPSHIHRAGENPVEAIAAVLPRVKHVHIRDCKGRQQNPGKPEDQANGRATLTWLVTSVFSMRWLLWSGQPGSHRGKGLQPGPMRHDCRRSAGAHAGLSASLSRQVIYFLFSLENRLSLNRLKKC